MAAGQCSAGSMALELTVRVLLKQARLKVPGPSDVAGDIVEVSDAEAQRLFDQRSAVPADPPQPDHKPRPAAKAKR
jgi:hypothetical protein